MPGQLSRAPFFAAVLASLFAPSLANARPPSSKPMRTAHVTKAKPCTKAPVEVLAGAESATFSLSKCAGEVIPAALDELSVLARQVGTPKPTESLAALGKSRGADLAPGVRRLDARLAERLESVVEHFGKGSETPHVVLVSGYRPGSGASYHSTGRALDFRIDGVKNEALVAFCKTLPDTGCGYYPNSVFVHMDVRDHGAGHVAWVDASAPGEAPQYEKPATVTPAPAPAPALSLLTRVPASATDAAQSEQSADDRGASAALATPLPELPPTNDHHSVAPVRHHKRDVRRAP